MLILNSLETSTNENSIVVEYSYVFNVIREGNGGFVYCDKQFTELLIYYSSFNKCHVTETACHGGAVYFSSNQGKIDIKRVSAFYCSAYEGHFIFITDSTEAHSYFELVSTDQTYGNWRGSILLYTSSLEAIDYNSSFCKTDKHCNFHVLQCNSNTKSSYFNFYKCQSDILYGIDSSSDNVKGYFEHSNFLENSKSEGSLGLLYTNSIETYILECNCICFYENTHSIISGRSGTINVYNLYFDIFNAIGSYVIKCSFSATKPKLTNLPIFNQICHTFQEFNYHSNRHFMIYFLFIILIV